MCPGNLVRIFAALSLIACSAANKPPLPASLPAVRMVGDDLCMSQETASAMLDAETDRRAACAKKIEAGDMRLHLEQAAHADTRRQLQRTLWWAEWGPVLTIGGIVFGVGAGVLIGFVLGGR